MRPLVWLRADLRTRDNPALAAATRGATRGVLAVFTICPRQWRDKHDLSPAKADLIRRTLTVLSKDLEKLNIPLLLVERDDFSDVPAALLDLAKKHACDALFFNDEYEWNERQRDDAARTLFHDAGLEVCSFTDQTVFPPGAIRTGQGHFYSVFTPFKKSWIAQHAVGGATDEAPNPKRQPELLGKPDPIPASFKGFDADASIADLWPAGEHEAHRRLTVFCNGPINAYADERDLPALESTSALSPYLNVGALSTKQCVNAALAINRGRLNTGADGPIKWISELIWREFYRHILVGFPRVSRGQPFQLATRRIQWNDNPDHLAAWQNGRTGVPIVDAAMRQLARTGWMHNRLRMIAAMYLTKDLFLDWRLGERFFSRNLIDGDLASNNGGWQWSASTGVDAAPYFRIFNPSSQSKKFDPDAEFIKRYVPELADLDAKDIHDPSTRPAVARARLDYPAPLVDHARARDCAIAAFKAIK
ncbi:MAG: deoxyribodipyrimidine photo-lyase [Phycisphaerales bacterium]